MAAIGVMQQWWDDNEHGEFTPPLPIDAVAAFFGWLVTEKHKDKPAAFSTFCGYKSALMWHYAEHDVVVSAVDKQKLDQLVSGYKREVANLKLAGKMPMVEGKLALTFDGYRSVAQALFSGDDMLFGWPYLLLQWNLIARTSSVSTMMMQHIGWESDSLLITLPKHKGDQEGANSYARHIYANPLDPIMCPVLALAVQIFTRILRHDPDFSSDSTSLPSYRVFDGPNPGARWSDVLRRALMSLPDSEVVKLGGAKTELGTHSVRKGASTYCTGMVNGPNPVHVYLRAGWSLGDTQNRYLFAGSGGDQLTGRVLCGLPFNDSSFAQLPAHFDAAGLAQIDWPTVLPLYSRMPQSMKVALPFLLAAICHHEPWLRQKLPADHPLFNSCLFISGAVSTLSPLVLLGRSRCAVTSLQATGIPPHLAMSNELNGVMRETFATRDALLTKYNEMRAELPKEMVTVMLGRFTVNGAIPVHMDDIKALVSQLRTELRADLRTDIRDALPGAGQVPVAASAAAAVNDGSRFQCWTWGGSFHMVPQGWRFPSTDAKTTWIQWHFGHAADRIQPLRNLRASDMASPAQMTTVSKARGVMRALAQVMVEMKIVDSVDAVDKLTQVASCDAFDRAIVTLMERTRAGSSQEIGRWSEMSIITMYDHVHKLYGKRKRRADEAEQEQGGAAAAAQQGEAM